MIPGGSRFMRCWRAPNLEFVNLNAAANIAVAVHQQEVAGIVIDMVPDVDVVSLVASLGTESAVHPPPIVLLGPAEFLGTHSMAVQDSSNTTRIVHAPSLEMLLSEIVLPLDRKDSDLTLLTGPANCCAVEPERLPQPNGDTGTDHA
jgi:hypothetical protein